MSPRRKITGLRAGSGPYASTPIIDAKSSLTPETLEAELRSLAAKARKDAKAAASPPACWLSSSVRRQLSIYGRALLLLFLAAASANASREALSPVYGAIPAAHHHRALIVAACFVGWSSNLFLRRLPVVASVRKAYYRPWAAPLVFALPLLAAYLPMAQYYLESASSLLTARWGPTVTELLTLFPLVALSAACVASELERAAGLEDWFPRTPAWIADAMPGIGSWTVFELASLWTQGAQVARFLHFFVGTGSHDGSGLLSPAYWASRVLRQVVVAAVYAFAAPSRLLWYALPALLHAAFFNVHLAAPARWTMPALNTALQSSLARSGGVGDAWVVLDRRESVTGYISVLDNLDEGFRVLRCDHSLLGGEWTRFPADPVAEPIYGVFVMLEAIRLIGEPRPDARSNALVIGLGIGTAPAALVAHGIDTTVVEIDPAVHDFAARYFHLPANHTGIVEDAVVYAERTARDTSPHASRFDYIIHDVFTGGAEPMSLFTIEFLQNLYNLLKPDGIIAINYAGDLDLTPIKAVVHTIRTVFPSCRIFREHPPDPEAPNDFANVVIFCTRNGDPVAFRKPVPADMLRSQTRQHFLLPVHEVFDDDLRSTEEVRLVRLIDTEQLAKWHSESAIGHWAVMRTVLPARIWELW